MEGLYVPTGKTRQVFKLTRKLRSIRLSYVHPTQRPFQLRRWGVLKRDILLHLARPSRCPFEVRESFSNGFSKYPSL